MFGRYIATKHNELSSYSLSGGNAIATQNPNIDNLAQTLTVGNTMVLGANVVNALRFAYNRTAVHRFNDDFFTLTDLGVPLFNHSTTREMQLAVTNGFSISRAQASQSTADNDAIQVSNELTLVRGATRSGFGASLAYWTVEQWSYSQANGNFTFNGQNTGLGLADFLVGRPSRLHAGQQDRPALPSLVPGAVRRRTPGGPRAASP